MHKKFMITMTLLVTTGCVSISQIPMTEESANALKNREVAIGQRSKPDFAAMTAGKAAFAAFGAAAMISAGNEIVAKNNVEDPAVYISEKLSKDLTAKYGATISAKPASINSDDVHEIAQGNPGTAVLLDVRTINWQFAYFPTTWSKYRVIYVARLRLIDVKSEKVLAEGGCRYVPDETPSAPTYEELLANNAERLKKELTGAADACVTEFRTNVLKL